MACGPGRAIGLGEETCHDEANCQPQPTTTTTGVGDDEGETSTSTTSSDDGPDDWGEEGGNDDFIPFPDNLETSCNTWDLDACPEGEKCTAYATQGSSWDANKCVEIMGDKQWLEPCTAFDSAVDGLDSCGNGLFCWDVGQNYEGHCLAFCTGSANDPVCPSGGICRTYGNGVLSLCYPTCDPLTPTADCANPDNLCVADPGGLGFFCVLDASGGMATYGTECMYANSCNYGLFCASAEHVPGCQGAQGCCSEYCDVDQPNTCAGKDQGQVCIPWWEMGMAPPGYDHVGGCAIPE